MAKADKSNADPSIRPFSAFRFAVEITIDGISKELCAAAFAEVDGLEMNVEPKTFREGGRNTGPVHLVGPTGYGQLTLRRGMSPNFDLWKWFGLVTSPGHRGVRPKVEVVMFAADGEQENARFVLEGVMPTRIKAPTLNARDGGVAIEEMQLVYQHMRLKESPAPGESAPVEARR